MYQFVKDEWKWSKSEVKIVKTEYIHLEESLKLVKEE